MAKPCPCKPSDIDLAEFLYRRHPRHLDFASSTIYDFSSQSFNRSAFSKPLDVVPDINKFRVVRILTGDVPQPMKVDEGNWSFKPTHTPLEDNCAHSELFGFLNEVHDDKVVLTKKTRHTIRTALFQKMEQLRGDTWES